MVFHTISSLQNQILIRSTRQTLDNPSTDNPRVVFFPTNQGTLSSSNVCQDDVGSNGHNSFNTFAFLSFALTIFNAMRYVFFYEICSFMLFLIDKKQIIKTIISLLFHLV